MAEIVLITGGCGFIGSNLVRFVRRERPTWRVVNVDKLTYAASSGNLADIPEGEAYRFVHGDVADRDLIRQVFEEERPHYIVHLAAESHVDRSIVDAAPFLHTNVIGTHVLLEAARSFGVERFLYVSTDEVYGDVAVNDVPCPEDSPMRPSSPYAASKAAADLLVKAYHRTYGLPVLIVRPCNHYGPYQYPEKLIPFMIRCFLRGDKLPLYGDGQQRRDWLFVEDGVRALLAVLERGRIGQAYNVAARQEHANLAVVELLCTALSDLLGCPPEAVWSEVTFVTDRPGHDYRYAVDDARLRNETGWEPYISLPVGIRRTAEWYLSHQAWLERADNQSFQAYRETVYSREWGRR